MTSRQFNTHSKTGLFFDTLKTSLSQACLDEHGQMKVVDKANLLHVVFQGEKGKAVCAFFVNPEGTVEMYRDQQPGSEDMGTLNGDNKKFIALVQDCHTSVMEMISEAIGYEQTLAENLRNAIADLHRRP